MGAWKQFLASDFIVVPFEVSKGFSFPYSQWETGSDGQLVGIDRFYGQNVSWSNIFNQNSTTGDFQVEYDTLVYRSTKQLYYSNFLFSSSGDPANLRVLVPGAGPSGSGDTFIGSGISGSGPLYDNFLQSTLVPQRNWPTDPEDSIVVISIPSKIYGEYIVPTSFIFDYSSSFKAYDDGEGNLYSSASFTWVSSSLQEFFYSESVEFLFFFNSSQITLGSSSPPAGYTFASASWQGTPNKSPFFLTSSVQVQVIGNQGITFDASSGVMDSDGSLYDFADTSGDTGPIELLFYSSSILNTSFSVAANQNVGNIIYPHGMAIFTNQNLPLLSISTVLNVTCSFSSSYTIYETQYKCTIREDEFNYTLNPSAQASGSMLSVNSGSGLFYQPGNGQFLDNLTGSYFSPYITTVGLYNEAQELIAIGKMSQPVPTSNTTDLTILINLDF
jgi:hypothetical protein